MDPGPRRENEGPSLLHPQMAAVSWEDSGLCTQVMGLDRPHLWFKSTGENQSLVLPEADQSVLWSPGRWGVGNVFCESLGVIFI